MKILKLMTLGVIALATMTACSDDDDNGGSGSSKAVLKVNGERLVAVNRYEITYDAQGRVSEINGQYDDERLKINYSKGTIIADGESGSVKFTSEGYLSEASASWDVKDEGYRYKGSGTLKFTYTNGVLTKVVSTSTETETSPDKKTTKWQEQETTTLTWNAGNLMRIKTTGWESENGEKDTWEETYKMEYGEQTNTFRQFSMVIADYGLDFDGTLGVLAAVGLFGKGTTLLPTDLQETDDDGYNWGTSIRFMLNSNFSISQESYSYNTYNYYYSGDNDAKTRAESAAKDDAKKLNLRTMFVKSHRRNK